MRFINPNELLFSRRINKYYNKFEVCILIFRDNRSSSLITAHFTTTPLNCELLYGIPRKCLSVSVIQGRSTLIVENLVWGGPQTAIIVEELSCLGVKYIFGIGACGSICDDIQKGDIVIDENAYILDGTSLHYSKKKSISISEENKNKLLKYKVAFVSSATIDALYQETSKLINSFKKKNIQVINMESAPLYAVSQYVGIESIWIGCVTDTLLGKEWSNWLDNCSMTNKSAFFAKKIMNTLLIQSQT